MYFLMSVWDLDATPKQYITERAYFLDAYRDSILNEIYYIKYIRHELFPVMERDNN